MTSEKWARPGVLVETEHDRQRAAAGHLAWRGAAAVDRQIAREDAAWVDFQLSRLPGRRQGETRRSVRERARDRFERAGGAKNAAANRELRALAEVHEQLEKLPSRWASYVEKEHWRRGGAACEQANEYVREVAAGAGGPLPLAATDDDLRALAKQIAKRAQGVAAEGAGDGQKVWITAEKVGAAFAHIDHKKGRHAAEFLGVVEQLKQQIGAGVAMRNPGGFGARGRATGAQAVLDELLKICDEYGVAKPDLKWVEDIYPLIARLCCSRWWLRKLRRAHAQQAEGAAIGAGLVRRGLWIYSTQDAVERRRDQRKRNARSVEEATMWCAETGEEIALAEVVSGSIANPENKRGELMVRVKACDAIAAERGHACEFWTLTTPSRFHAQRMINGAALINPAYEGAMPSDGQRWLSAAWAKARAKWGRRGLDVFGLRTAEPHHDGTPHWHLIVYGEKEELRLARWLLKQIALQDAGWEPGAKEHRFNWQAAAAGTRGAAYAMKYVSKNIDGKGLENELDDEGQKKISASVKRVDAWAAHWRIRQFQFFGCPKVTAWRILRKFDKPVGVEKSALERARAAADDGDFAEFWRACESSALEIIYRDDARKTMYGDDAKPVACGVQEGGRRAVLERKTWVITWSGVKLSDEVKRVFSAGGLGFAGIARPRSCVNNCTRSDERGGVEKEEAGGLAGVFEREAGGVGWLVDKFF